jgi:hypothetical protein
MFCILNVISDLETTSLLVNSCGIIIPNVLKKNIIPFSIKEYSEIMEQKKVLSYYKIKLWITLSGM